MTEKLLRDQPYFPLYCANLIADHRYRLMNLSERGLYLTMLVECWHNGKVPENPVELSKFLGYQQIDIDNSLSERVLSFFSKEQAFLKNKEVESEKAKILERRLKQSLGGKDGAKRKKEKYSNFQSKGQPLGQPEGSLGYINSDQINSIQVNQERDLPDIHEDWKNEFDPPKFNAYLIASKGA
jgi:uncharacterized protein YdaU (DUF1376 family)